MITLIRLKNGPKGHPYAIEKVEDVQPKGAGQMAMSWWESNGTIALIVMNGEEEDSRYVKEYADRDRFPPEWPAPEKPDKPKKPIETPAALRRKPTKTALPTLLGKKQRSKREKCPVCGRMVPEVETTEAEHGCPECGQAFMCRTCLHELPPDRKYPNDDDPTPSGRLAARRCPDCGRPMRDQTGKQIWALYTRRRKR